MIFSCDRVRKVLYAEQVWDSSHKVKNGYTAVVLFSLQLLFQKFLFPADVRSNARRTSYKTAVTIIPFIPKSLYAIAVKNLEFDENVLSCSHVVTCGRRGIYN
jgi:hypothetical protein